MHVGRLSQNGLTTEAAGGALAFMTHNRTWLGMIAAGATATMEVWTTRDKPNLSWSHPWCSAPANIVPRRLMGIQPLRSGVLDFGLNYLTISRPRDSQPHTPCTMTFQEAMVSAC